MPLILITFVAFATLGLASRRFGTLQNGLVAAIAVALALIQLLQPRYL